MQFRQHRGSLADSMETVAVMEPTFKAILNYLKQQGVLGFDQINSTNAFHCKRYGYDERIDWNTYLISVDGHGVVGFTDTPIHRYNPLVEFHQEFHHQMMSGSIGYDEIDAVYRGIILNIPVLVPYEAKTLEELEEMFQSAVDHYLGVFNYTSPSWP